MSEENGVRASYLEQTALTTRFEPPRNSTENHGEMAGIESVLWPTVARKRCQGAINPTDYCFVERWHRYEASKTWRRHVTGDATNVSKEKGVCGEWEGGTRCFISSSTAELCISSHQSTEKPFGCAHFSSNESILAQLIILYLETRLKKSVVFGLRNNSKHVRKVLIRFLNRRVPIQFNELRDHVSSGQCL